MGELGDDWREHREYLRSKGVSRSRPKPRAVVVKLTKDWQALGFRACTEWHWQARVGGVLIDYWPSKRKWQWAGKVQTGTAEDLVTLVKSIAIAGSRP